MAFKFCSTFLIVFITTLSSCGPKTTTAISSPDQKEQHHQASTPLQINDCQNAMNSESLSSSTEKELAEKILQGLDPNRVFIIDSCLDHFIPAGTYQGHLESGGTCEVSRTYVDNGIRFNVRIDQGPNATPINLHFNLVSGDKSTMALQSFSKMRSSIQILELEQSFLGENLFLNTLSLHRNLDGILSVYIFRQSRLETDMASVNCILN